MRGGRIVKLLKRLALGAAITLVVMIAVAYAWYHLTLYKKAPEQEGWLALTGITALVGERLERRSGTTILIRDGDIVRIAANAWVDIPEDAVRIDLSGYTVLPGLIDVHVHLGGPDMELGQELGPLQIVDVILEWLRFAPGARRAFLEHGVTAVRDLGNSYDWVTDLRGRLRHGDLEGPRLFVAGPLFSTSGGHPVVTIFANDPAGARESTRLPGSPEEARRMVRELAAGEHPVDVVKGAGARQP